jgi:ankyrin repeat protein
MKYKFIILSFIIIAYSFINVYAQKSTTLESEMFDAIRTGDIKKFEKLLKKGVSMYATNNNDETYLHALFNYRGERFSSNDILMLNKLIEKGCNVNAIAVKEYKNERFESTVLELAILSRKSEAVEILLNNGADVNQGYPIHRACFKRWFTAVELVVNKGADVNKLFNGETPLILLLKYADPYKQTLKILEFLHNKGANIFEKNAYGESLVDLANNNNNYQAANYLKNNGVTAKYKPVTTPTDDNKKVGLTLSRTYTRRYETKAEIISTIVKLSVTPDKIKIYDEYGNVQYNLTIVKSNYIKYQGVDAVEYYAKDNEGRTFNILLLKMQDLYTYSNGIKTFISGYNRLLFRDGNGNTVTLDAEW